MAIPGGRAVVEARWARLPPRWPLGRERVPGGRLVRGRPSGRFSGVRRRGLEPLWCYPLAPQASASANSATFACREDAPCSRRPPGRQVKALVVTASSGPTASWRATARSDKRAIDGMRAARAVASERPYLGAAGDRSHRQRSGACARPRRPAPATASAIGAGCSSSTSGARALRPSAATTRAADAAARLGRGIEGHDGGTSGREPWTRGTVHRAAVRGLACAVALAAGGGHVCALLDDHTVRCWGQNSSGELGFGTYDAGTSCRPDADPDARRGLAEVTQSPPEDTAVGFGTTCADPRRGGRALLGQSTAIGALGSARATEARAPAQSIAPLPLALDAPSSRARARRLLRLRAGRGRRRVVLGRQQPRASSARRSTRARSIRRRPPVPSAAPPRPWRAGKSHACALLADHVRRVLGGRRHGQIGLVFDGGVATPQTVAGLSATQLTAGEVSTCAITTTGGVVVLGRQSGRPARPRRLRRRGRRVDRSGAAAGGAPRRRHGAADRERRRKHVRAPLGSHGLVLGRQRLWRARDRIGGPRAFRRTPAPVQGLSNIVQIASSPGGWTVCALLQEGTVRCWGSTTPTSWGSTRRATPGRTRAPHPVPVRVLF